METVTAPTIGPHGMKGRNTGRGRGRAGSGMTGGCWELELSKAKGVSVGEDCSLEKGQVYWPRAWLTHRLRLSSVRVCSTSLEGQRSRELVAESSLAAGV